LEGDEVGAAFMCTPKLRFREILKIEGILNKRISRENANLELCYLQRYSILKLEVGIEAV
jgi:hypothetical protein